MDRPKDLTTFINTNPSHLDQFEKFLCQHGLYKQLEFVWAAQGLKLKSENDEDTVKRTIRTIHKHYFEEIRISESVKLKVTNKISDEDYSLDIFDQAVEEVWTYLDFVVYKQFLSQWDSKDGGSSNGSSSSNSNVPRDLPAAQTGPTDAIPSISSTDRGDTTAAGQRQKPATSSTVYYQPPLSSVPKIPSASLEPLIEGQELRNKSSGAVSVLTRKALQATEKVRSGIDVMPESLSNQMPEFPYHSSNYTSFNPVSRQDSEVQSFSSGCLTDSEQNIETRSKRKPTKTLYRDNLPPFACLRTAANQNYEHNATKASAESKQKCQEFAKELIYKLTLVKREQDKNNDASLAIALRDRLTTTKCMQDETQPDDILDEHVSRVWSDVTPDSARSPPGRREYKRNKFTASNALRPRIHVKQDQEHQLSKSRTFPSTSKYDQDSGISITTTSTSDEFIRTWANNSSSSKPSTKSNPVKTKSKKEISCLVFYQHHQLDNRVPFSFKIPATNRSLSVFKENLPKRGNYRYFFKCRLHGSGATVKEEITKDEELLPLFDGKIIAELEEA